MVAGKGVEIVGPPGDRFEEILTPDALDLVAMLQREFGGRRAELLAARAARQEELSAGGTLDFLPETTAHQGGPPLAGAAARAGPGGPAGGDHRARPSGR